MDSLIIFKFHLFSMAGVVLFYFRCGDCSLSLGGFILSDADRRLSYPSTSCSLPCFAMVDRTVYADDAHTHTEDRAPSDLRPPQPAH